jgi:hypothetical protein
VMSLHLIEMQVEIAMWFLTKKKEGAMYKRTILIIALCVGVWGTLEFRFTANSSAACKIYLGKLCCTDVCAETFLKGVGNSDVNNVAVCVNLLFEIEAYCKNPAWQAEPAQGDPFYTEISIGGTDLLREGDLTGERGQAVIDDMCWSLEQIEEHIENSIVCKEPNWNLDDWSIIAVYVYHASYQQDKKGNLKSTSELCRRCEIKPDAEFGTSTGGTDDCGVECVDLTSADVCKESKLDTLCLDAVSYLFNE